MFGLLLAPLNLFFKILYYYCHYTKSTAKLEQSVQCKKKTKKNKNKTQTVRYCTGILHSEQKVLHDIAHNKGEVLYVQQNIRTTQTEQYMM